jgi:hypothetical protein
MQVWQEDRVHHTKNAKPAKSEINTTPPPPAIRARPPAVTDQASDLTNKAHNKQHKNIKQIIGATRSSCCLLGAKAIEPRSL